MLYTACPSAPVCTGEGPVVGYMVSTATSAMVSFPAPAAAGGGDQREDRQKPAHAKIAPVLQWRVHTWIDLAHASQHSVIASPKGSAPRPERLVDAGSATSPDHCYGRFRRRWERGHRPSGGDCGV